MILYDGLDSALIGVGKRCGQPDVAVYDAGKIIEHLLGCGMPAEEAEEYFEFNILGGWIGEETPIILMEMEEE